MNDKIYNKLYWYNVALDVPMRTNLFEYKYHSEIQIGTRVIVPFGRRKMVGIVISIILIPTINPLQIKNIDLVLYDFPPFSKAWIELVKFTANYYQRSIGEISVNAIPALLRKVSSYIAKNKKDISPIKKLQENYKKYIHKYHVKKIQEPILNSDQKKAVDVISNIKNFQTVLLYGVTGSGKTEVYLHIAKDILLSGFQVLFLVPEINLTPQLEEVIINRFYPIFGENLLTIMHSGLSDKERLFSWINLYQGKTKILLGTRMAIFAELPKLGLIIVDEEHDQSYKEQHGSRYSARDLAIWRGKNLNIPVILGSATPSLETWLNVINKKYLRLNLKNRAKSLSLPSINLVNTKNIKLVEGFSEIVIESIKKCLEKKKKVLIFINRRGYAPILYCKLCSWLSTCLHCSTFTVLHKIKEKNSYLQCHHCGKNYNIPINCPSCHNNELSFMGYGTQRVEEYLSKIFINANILRIDSDSNKNRYKNIFDNINSKNIDIFIGTQMLSKGHDFIDLELVCILNADMMIFSQDFRASEKLFAQLIQVSGRAGRHNTQGKVIIQTSYPEHEIYKTLLLHDYEYFANLILKHRKMASLPPFSYQALIIAESSKVTLALNFLNKIKEIYYEKFQNIYKHVLMFDPIPLRILRISNIERAQLLIESINRAELHKFINIILYDVELLAKNLKIKWHIEIDPLEI
ncbi:Primosomal protein N' [Candidatus Kinetoplastibacterium sorsogonicusi]|uniref:Replication restart protein PriA n=1 Tax=Candidatus Kinetoplastidibacterium kentomonadis TaxID=1576550 RepID=A0A3Q8ER74_9PROT|nr:primosomal protein N' [Candidatus Kinetoplastibacterium sorsogonicusi]AWD32202.1 Primosomal protein N' [Candidatus Kinetoplastibacterium sorsogonicusi]